MADRQATHPREPRDCGKTRNPRQVKHRPLGSKCQSQLSEACCRRDAAVVELRLGALPDLRARRSDQLSVAVHPRCRAWGLGFHSRRYRGRRYYPPIAIDPWTRGKLLGRHRALDRGRAYGPAVAVDPLAGRWRDGCSLSRLLRVGRARRTSGGLRNRGGFLNHAIARRQTESDVAPIMLHDRRARLNRV